MKKISHIIFIICILVFATACKNSEESGENRSEQTEESISERSGEGPGEHSLDETGEHAEEGQSEHSREVSGEPSGEGEASGQTCTLTETFDHVRKGVRLILAYDKTTSSFMGTVENVTENTIKSVRVEVHLSNGTELGPTKSINLTAGQKESVKLTATGQSFNWWKAHAEAGAGEHSGEGRGEHEREGRGEHSGQG